MIYLRTRMLLPLDDLLAVIHEFIEPAMSRSALDRLLRRRGHSRLPAPAKPENESQPFKLYEPGYVHIDVKFLPQMQDEDKRRYVFVAIDRATRWVFIQIRQHKSAAAARAFLAALKKAAPFKIRTILADNGKPDRQFRKAAVANMNLICCAKSRASSIVSNVPERPAPTGWWSASMAGSARCCTHITSTAQKTWRRRCTALCGCITSRCRRKRSGMKRRFRRSNDGGGRFLICWKRMYVIVRDLTVIGRARVRMR